MVSVEVIVGAIGAITGLGGLIFGGGMFNKMLNHNAAMAVQKHELQQAKTQGEKNDVSIQGLTTKVALINKDIEGFSMHVKKLDMLPEISTKLSGIESLIGYMREQIKDFRTERIDHDKNN